METKKERTTPIAVEELNETLDSIDIVDKEESHKFVSKYWSVKLLYGKLVENPRSTYAIEFTSKLGNKESATYLYSVLCKDKKRIQDALNDFGYLPEGEYEKILNYAEYLKRTNQQIKCNTLDAKLTDCEADVVDCKEKLCNYVLDHPEMIASKCNNEFDQSKHIGAWIKTTDGKIVLALVNKHFKEIINVSSTTKIGNIKRQMVADGFLKNLNVADITLSKGIEKKCSIFYIQKPEEK